MCSQKKNSVGRVTVNEGIFFLLGTIQHKSFSDHLLSVVCGDTKIKTTDFSIKYFIYALGSTKHLKCITMTHLIWKWYINFLRVHDSNQNPELNCMFHISWIIVDGCFYLVRRYLQVMKWNVIWQWLSDGRLHLLPKR